MHRRDEDLIQSNQKGRHVSERHNVFDSQHLEGLFTQRVLGVKQVVQMSHHLAELISAEHSAHVGLTEELLACIESCLCNLRCEHVFGAGNIEAAAVPQLLVLQLSFAVESLLTVEVVSVQ